MPGDIPETIDAREHQQEDLQGAARVALEILNPHVYYDPTGKYSGGLVIPTGHYMGVAVAVRSWGWDVTEQIPEVKLLLERMNVVLQIAREKPVG